MRKAWIIMVFFMCAYAPVFAAEVTVKTAKAAYASGEPVEIVLSNGSGGSIWSLAKSDVSAMAVRNLEVKNPRGIWDAFFLKSRRESGSVFEKAGEIKPGETVTFLWKPAVLEKGKEEAPGPGHYRLTVIYHLQRPGIPPVFGTAKSNEFDIR